jgi:nucleotide-binding universal stress UspA family protein
MSGIVCAVRGGPDSQPTISKAITWAKDTELPLYFLYVVNLDFLTHTSSSRVHTVAQQIEQMGEFILLTAQSEASAHGVTAQGIVRHGSVMEEITKLCHEVEAGYLVIGSPKGKEEHNVFTHDALASFVARIEQQTEAKVIMPGGENQ